MNDLEMVFWSFTIGDLALAAGRYLLFVSSILLVLKNVVWAMRWGRRERRAHQKAWLAIETAVGLVIMVVYAHHLYADGVTAAAATTALARLEDIAIVWAVALMFVGDLLMRSDDRPP